MSIQFKRTAIIDVFNGADITVTIKDVRISFNIEKTITKEYNTCNIDVYNLSRKTRDLINGDKQFCRLSVGYGSDYSTLYFGDLTFVNHTFEEKDIVTKIECVDKMNAEKHIKIFETENANILDFIKRSCSDNGIALAKEVLDKIKDKLNTTVLAGGFSFIGRAKDAFDEISATIGTDWSLQDGILQFLNKGGVLSETPIYADYTTGLIGVPEGINDVNTKSGNAKRAKDGSIKRPPQAGFMVTTLLNPNIKPGILMKIKSDKAEINGNMAVHGVTHNGDNYGSNWLSISRCILR